MANSYFVLGTPIFQAFMPGTATPLVGGKLYTYLPGGTTPTPSYPTVVDAQNNTNANTNPIILDANGSASVVLQGPTKLRLTDASGFQEWTFDNFNLTASNIYDSNGNALLLFTSQNNAQNEITIANAVTGNPPTIGATGNDINVGLRVNTQGTGVLEINAPLQLNSAVVQGANALQVLGIHSITAANTYVDITNASNAGPTIGVASSSTNEPLVLKGKGNLGVNALGGTAGTALPAGYVGEVISATGVSGLNSGTTANLLSISLTPGNWLIWGYFQETVSGGLTQITASVGTTSAAITYSSYASSYGGPSGSVNGGIVTNPIFVTVSATTTYYLVGFISAGGSVVSANTSLTALRII